MSEEPKRNGIGELQRVSHQRQIEVLFDVLAGMAPEQAQAVAQQEVRRYAGQNFIDLHRGTPEQFHRLWQIAFPDLMQEER